MPVNKDPAAMSDGKVLWLLFFNFLKIATFVVGGGYAIMLAAERIFVDKLHWLEEKELFDMLAIVQTVPGLMAGNVAVYVGYRIRGRAGALAALAGVALPSFAIITLVSIFYARIPAENSYVQGAFVGVRAGLAGLTVAALLRMWRQAVAGLFGYTLVICCFAGTIFAGVNPAILLFGSLVLGVVRLCRMEGIVKRCCK